MEICPNCGGPITQTRTPSSHLRWALWFVCPNGDYNRLEWDPPLDPHRLI